MAGEELQETAKAWQWINVIKVEAGLDRAVQLHVQRPRACVSSKMVGSLRGCPGAAWREVRRAFPDCERPCLSHPKSQGKHASGFFYGAFIN